MDNVWETKDGRFALSIPGDFSWPTYGTRAGAETFWSGARSLGNFLNLPIEGGALTKWIEQDRAMRAEHQKVE